MNYNKRLKKNYLLAAVYGGLGWLAPGAAAWGQGVASSPLWQLCAPDALAAELSPATGVPDDGRVQFDADAAEVERGRAVLAGNVVVRRGDQRLRAPRVELDRTTNRASAEALLYSSPALVVQSARGSVDLNNESGVFDDTQYYIAERNAQGRAARVTVDRPSRQSTLNDVTYSTCERGAEFWQLHAGELHLDEAAGRGTARAVRLAIKNVPVFYWPYLSFPIDDRRQSGFLTPRAGLDEDSGFDLRLPYYWNIAPNQDATFTPRILSRRGLLLGAEYRYLSSWQRGEAELEYLPHDQVFGEDRSAVRIQHRAQPLARVFTDLLYQYVSDDDYIDDLGDNVDLQSPNFLERRFDVSYYGDFWNIVARAQGFQILDDELFAPADEPYDRLPQVLFTGSWPGLGGGLTLDVRGEWVRFADGTDRVEGTRLDLEPSLRWPLERAWGYFTPSLGYRYTAYWLDNTETADTPSRAAPVLSLDSGLFLERPVASSWLGDGVQTLEPRLFYLYVPRRDQGAIPLFDTVAIDESFPALFLTNRFTGADRLGDANQLTGAVTSRWLAAGSGQERLRASIGQSYYFSPRAVRLDADDDDDEDDDSSDFFAEAAVNFTAGVSLRGGWQWDPHAERTERSAFDVRYQPAAGQAINFSQRFARADLEQLDMSFLWTLNEQWRTVGRWNFSLKEDATLDAFAGLEYGDCCWAVRMLARHHRDEPTDEEANNSFYVELELKGLAGIGNRIDTLLRESIEGYEPIRYRN